MDTILSIEEEAITAYENNEYDMLIERIKELAEYYNQLPFSIGDEVEEIDFFGNVLRNGIVISVTSAAFGAVRVNFKIMGIKTWGYYPPGIRKSERV
jgi:hypothetical protein